MIGQEQDTHPTSEILAAFALGHVDDDEAALIADHLGICESCQQAVLAVPDDSMLSLLRLGGSTPMPRAPLEDVTTFDDAVPTELRDHARYQVLRRLGAGGMGVVYQCQHRLMGRTVAVKVINKGLVVDAAVVERFQRAVRAAARLAHPNLVQAFDAEQAGELHFLVLEFIEGVSLDALVKRDGPLPVDRACDYVRQAALGLAHAAAQGLVHRDIKPQNIMVTPEGQVKVMDFGLASISAERSGEGGLTEAGQGLGTPDYIAPEQISDARTADARADIYSLGCTIYFLLSGRPPFPKGNSAQKVAAHLEQQPEPLARLRPELPAGLVQVIDKMMAKDPARRYQTAAAVVAALAPWCQAPEPTSDRPGRLQAVRAMGRRRRNSAVVGGAVLVLVAAAIAYLVFQVGGPDRRVASPLLPGVSLAGVEPGGRPQDLSKVMPLIVDDFSDPDKSHFSAAGPNKFGNESRLENRRLVLLQGRESTDLFTWPSQQAVEGDFACEVVGRAVAGEGGWALGLVTPNWDRAVAVCLRRDGTVEVGDLPWGQRWNVPATKVQTLRPSNIYSDDKENTLLVILRGGRRLEIYVNGAAISRPIQLAHPLAPRVIPQIVTWSRQVEFTRFKLWLVSPPAPLEPGEEKRAPDLTGVKWAINDDFSNPKKSKFCPLQNNLAQVLFADGRFIFRHLWALERERPGTGPAGCAGGWNSRVTLRARWLAAC